MESFGFWYKLNSAQKGPDYLDQKKETLEQPTIDLHVNFWFLGDIPKHKTNQPYLDIGVQISQYKGLENIIFSFPFMLPDENIEDLAPKMSSKENASIVFNEECEIETKSEYTVVSIPDKDKLLIFPLDQAVEGIYNIEKYKGRSYIEIKFEQFEKYLKTNIELSDYNNIYIRFRIKETDLKNILYFDSEPFNKSLDSAFSGTRILDFKINEKRNIDKNIVARMDSRRKTC